MTTRADIRIEFDKKEAKEKALEILKDFQNKVQ